jgi:hypothetical protein
MPPKRKSDAASGSAAKKARHEEQHVAARTLVARVLDDGATGAFPPAPHAAGVWLIHIMVYRRRR